MIIEEQIRPFESIESAYEFVTLLEESVEDALREVTEHARAAETDDDARRAEALRLAVYKLGQLSTHMHKSRRLLNDLRTIRRLLFRERADGLELADGLESADELDAEASAYTTSPGMAASASIDGFETT